MKTTLMRGFSLLEALVALIIAAITLAALYGSVGQSSKNAVDVQTRVQAALVVRSVLASATFAEDLEGQPAGQWGAWRWNVQLQPETIAMYDDFPRPPEKPQTVARVTVQVTQEGQSPLTWTVWKPYRTPP